MYRRYLSFIIVAFLMSINSFYSLNALFVSERKHKTPSSNTIRIDDQLRLNESLIQSKKWAFIQGGTFYMGKINNIGDPDELPIHKVTLSSFILSRHEVTQGEYFDVMGYNPSSFNGNSALPVENVCFYNAIEYCNKLSFSQGLQPCYEYLGSGFDTDDWPIFWNASDHNNIICHWEMSGFRLPSEAEWEYAARGGQFSHDFLYSGSNDPTLVAWFSTNAGNGTHQVNQKLPNELGLYDMSGNIWEVVWDYYGAYPEINTDNPHGPEYGIYRVFRGGMWQAAANYARTTNRSMANSTSCAATYGFRVARSIAQ